MSSNTFHSLVQDVNNLSHQLISDQTNDLALSPAMLEAVRSAKASLSTAIASVNESSPLPIKKKIAPNQHSWTETARAMGIKKAAKCHLPEEVGLTERPSAPQKVSTARYIQTHMQEARDLADWQSPMPSLLVQIIWHANACSLPLPSRLWLVHFLQRSHSLRQHSPIQAQSIPGSPTTHSPLCDSYLQVQYSRTYLIYLLLFFVLDNRMNVF